ncbi:MAG: hypothetical protein ACR2RE_21095 [Geminicoccaceae bacterium]
MTDRFDEIKELYELGNWPSNPNEAFELSEWLITEVERQRERAEKAEGEAERLRNEKESWMQAARQSHRIFSRISNKADD